jgi:hypothetical protein
MSLNKMAHAVTFTSMLMIPLGKKLTAMQQWKKTCHKVRLPIKSSLRKVKQRLQRVISITDDQQMRALKQK